MNTKSIIGVGMLLIFSLFLFGCDEDPKDKQVYSEDFCTRFHQAFPSCDCFFDMTMKNDGLGKYEDGALYKSGRNISNKQDAEAFFNRWLYIVQENYFDTSKIADDTRIECDSLGHGFYNCFVFNQLYVTVSDDGDIYKTECGV